MTSVDHLSDLAPWVGRELGVSSWTQVDQSMISAFGRLTGDDHWIHVDRRRAEVEGPFGGTIAHGFFTLALLTGLLNECLQVTAARRWVNYGLDKVRFTTPVKPGDRLRLRLELASFEMCDATTARIACQCTLEMKGAHRPALVATYRILGHE